MTEGEGSASGRIPGPLSAALRAATFVLAVLGIVLVAIPPNPPQTLWHWAQVVGGASLTGFLTTFQGRYELKRLRDSGTVVLDWVVRKRVAVGASIVLTAGLVVGVPPAWEFARGVSVDVAGCSPATQLRLVASQETVTTARELASAYERWTAAENHGCPAVDVYVYAAGAGEIRAHLQSADAWSDQSGALREIGPRPDVWLATTSHEIEGIEAAATTTPIGHSPVVVAAPKAVAGEEEGERRDWADLFRLLTDRGVGVVRADPKGSELGLLATTLLYGAGGARGERQLAPAEIERRLAASLDEGGFHLTDAPGLLCRHRLLRSQAAVIASEQQVIRSNLREPLGGSCAPQADAPERLTLLYPSDTRSVDHQLVRLAWSEPPQEGAARAFGEWLLSGPGRDAVVRTGLRPAGPYSSGPPFTTGGADAGAAVPEGPVGAATWSGTATAYDQAQRRGRVLFAVDTSGSMATAGAEGTRSAVAAAAVSTVLRRMGPRDEFGLWLFPDASGAGHVEAVPIGPPDEPRHALARQALGGVRPAGGTPFFRTMIDAAAVLPGNDSTRVDAVVVLTDGEDTTSGLDAGAVDAAIAGRGVRLIVVTIGEVRCADAGLSAITTATAGDCVDADLANLETALSTATAGLWGGR
ncbi:substrate-binding and VWA domain-containing protein [Pseudonocardia aurantiaca]|uniref:Substrate-binding domain-containing protein n=1 Tax=Pseudonocardia aurantiaca TaxID=75290 RepID=A0ABW4FQC3_9PSEU